MKGKREIKAAKTERLQRLEHTEVFDDSLLPDAVEIQKLFAIDPEILNWLKLRAEKEQDYRHAAYDKRLNVLKNHNQREHNTARYALTIYFVLVLVCVAASYLLLQEGRNIQGSIFGGAAVILALAVLISKRPVRKIEKENE